MNTIRIEVEVPADLVQEFYPRVDGSYTLLCDKAGASLLAYTESKDWVSNLGRQIAAAIEARKPKPPKFAVGDVVEWQHGAGRVTAFHDTKDGEFMYYVNGLLSFGREDEDGEFMYYVNGLLSFGREDEDRLTLVRRAAK